jgi:hypothetical protein
MSIGDGFGTAMAVGCHGRMLGLGAESDSSEEIEKRKMTCLAEESKSSLQLLMYITQAGQVPDHSV